MKKNCLGVDLGGVIAERALVHTLLNPRNGGFLDVPPVRHAFETITRLCIHFQGRLHVVSLCHPRHEEWSRRWLERWNFYERTGILSENVHFCWDQQRKSKAPICHQLGITHFIDDRLEILASLREIVSNRYLFRARDKEIAKHREHLSGVIRVETWGEMLRVMGAAQ